MDASGEVTERGDDPRHVAYRAAARERIAAYYVAEATERLALAKSKAKR